MYVYQYRQDGRLWRGRFETNLPESEARKVIDPTAKAEGL